MSENTPDKIFLEFEEPDEAQSEAIPETNEENCGNMDLSPDDFALLARRASGINPDYSNNTADSAEEKTRSGQFSPSEEEENITSLFDEESVKTKLRKPYLKIGVGVLLSSFVLVGLLFFRGSWMRLMNLSQSVEDSEKESQVDPDKLNIDRLKAQLAMVKQNEKPIPKPEAPEPKPEPIPQPEPVAEPEPEIEPEIDPEIDPYEQWELLSKLGTEGSSDLDMDDFESADQNDRKNNNLQALRQKEDLQNTDDEETQNTSKEAAKTENKIASVTLNNSLGVEKSSQPQFSLDNSDDSKNNSQPQFSPDAEKVILSSLGISQPKPTERRGLADSNGSDSLITQTDSNSSGILAGDVAWTDNSKPEEIRGSITLAEPLINDEADIALPESSSIIFEVADYNSSGSVQLKAIAVVTKNDDGEFEQQEIADNSLVISGENNQPLKYETENENSNSGNSLLGEIVGTAIDTGTKSLSVPQNVSEKLSRTIEGAGSGRTNEGKFYFIEAQTPVSIATSNSVSVK